MKTLLDLNPSDCRWPVTDDKPHLFCAEPRDEGSSYCACHRATGRAPVQSAPLRGAELARLADFFGGGRARALNKAGGERGREAVDTAIKASLSNNARVKWEAANNMVLSRTAARRAAE